MRLQPRTSLPLFVFLSLLLALVVYWFGYDQPTYGIDDANIYFVYMKHFATGNGFVWNIGGEKVEGFTSLLWTLIGSLFYKLSGEGYVWLLFALNFMLTYISILRILMLVRRCNHTTGELLTSTDVIMMSLLLFPLGFIEWNIMSLMETGLWLFLITNLTVELCNFYLPGKKPNLFMFSFLLALMILTRPESIVFCLLFIFILFLQQAFDGGVKRALGKIIFPLVVYGFTLAAVTGWRIFYFGYPFPNTYYAKVSASEKDNIKIGLSYLHKLFYEYPQVGFTVAIGLVFSLLLLNTWRKEKSRLQLSANDKTMMVILGVEGCGLLLPVLTGGDHFKFSRFYQCIIPLTYASALNLTFWKTHIGGFSLHHKYVRILLTAALSFGIFFIAKSTWFDLTVPEKMTATLVLPEFYHARNGRTIAEKSNETFSSCARYPSVGLLAAGGFAYAYKGNTIDLMGLNSTLMAHATRIKQGFRNHASFDIATFWKMEPDIVGTFYGGELVTDTNTFVLQENTDFFRHGLFIYNAYKQIFDYPRFIQNYLPALVRNRKYDFYLFAYYNKSFLNTLDEKQFQVLLLERRVKSAVPLPLEVR
jgi:arabinofuranosyltransferase